MVSKKRHPHFQSIFFYFYIYLHLICFIIFPFFKFIMEVLFIVIVMILKAFNLIGFDIENKIEKLT